MRVEEILPDLYRVEVPLPGSPLRAVNSYVIRGEKPLIIDTGWNRKICRDVLVEALAELGINAGEADFVITHRHADHSGLVSSIAGKDSAVFMGEEDIIALRNLGPEVWEGWVRFAKRHGFPEEELERAIGEHPARKYHMKGLPPLRAIGDGDILKAGKYSLICVKTPGHTQGHIALYEPDKKILFSGDHILSDITPNISAWSETENRLEDYLKSLEKVLGLDVELVLPAHGRPFKDLRGKIEELKTHHRERLGEILSILEGGEKNAFEVASLMTWDIEYDSWDKFPPMQKWFAFGEAMAHLRFLEEKGLVERRGEETVIFRLPHSPK